LREGAGGSEAEHEDVVLHFCSLECAAFDLTPGVSAGWKDFNSPATNAANAAAAAAAQAQAAAAAQAQAQQAAAALQAPATPTLHTAPVIVVTATAGTARAQ